MSTQKGLELLKAIGKYMTETEGFDRVLKNVSKSKISANYFFVLTFGRGDVFQLPLHNLTLCGVVNNAYDNF